MNKFKPSLFKPSSVKTVSFEGINILETKIECNLLPGLPSFTIVGLGDKTINESKERVRSALFASNFSLPNQKIIINLAPANIYKEGSHYDLSIALAILVSMGELASEDLENTLIMGELSLSGEILPVNGILPSVIFAKKNNYKFIGSTENAHEMILDIPYISADNLSDLVRNIKNKSYFTPKIELNDGEKVNTEEKETIFDKIYGQEIGKKALIIAAAGKHNLMFIGPKGVGKSMLSRSIVDLLPNLSHEESLETTSIHSIAGILKNQKMLKSRPFRSPHSSSSLVSIIGGGSIPKPGEISLSHNGVLFLDELPEFQTSAIDALRTPLEERVVYISRSKYKIEYPSNFQLIVSMNPCKCGNLLTGVCYCKQKNYMYKVSSPIQDRIDLKIILNKVNFNTEKEECNILLIRNKIEKAMERQKKRFGTFNSQISVKILENNGGFEPETLSYLKDICIKKEFSGRSYLKTLSVSRTLADLDDSDLVLKNHINEAVFFVKNPLDSFNS